MSIHLFNSRAAARELARADLSPERQAQYLLVGLLIYLVASYSGLMIATAPLWSMASLLEAAALVLVNVLGVTQVLDAAGGPRSRRFLQDFTCLYVPVSVTSLLVIWSAYWVIRIGFVEGLLALSTSGSRFALNLAAIGTDFLGLLGFLCSVGTQVLVYYRLVRLQRLVESLRQAH